MLRASEEQWASIALALGQISGQDWWRVLRHELVMGLALGLTLGVFGFAGGYCFYFVTTHSEARPLNLGLTVGLAVICICLWGTIAAPCFPCCSRNCISTHIDPAIASNPFVATVCDVAGILIYFLIAKAFILD